MWHQSLAKMAENRVGSVGLPRLVYCSCVAVRFGCWRAQRGMPAAASSSGMAASLALA